MTKAPKEERTVEDGAEESRSEIVPESESKIKSRTMPITKEEYEGSDCLQKVAATTQGRLSGISSEPEPFYCICSSCLKRTKDPIEYKDLLCDGAARGRCRSMKDGEPTLREVFSDFLTSVKTSKSCTIQDIESTMDLFETAISRKWDCCKCKSWEASTGRNGYEEAWLTTHGLRDRYMLGEINSFCGYFITRKCFMGKTEKRKCYIVLTKLADFLATEEYITQEEEEIIGETIHSCTLDLDD